MAIPVSFVPPFTPVATFFASLADTTPLVYLFVRFFPIPSYSPSITKVRRVLLLSLTFTCSYPLTSYFLRREFPFPEQSLFFPDFFSIFLSTDSALSFYLPYPTTPYSLPPPIPFSVRRRPVLVVLPSCKDFLRSVYFLVNFFFLSLYLTRHPSHCHFPLYTLSPFTPQVSLNCDPPRGS